MESGPSEQSWQATANAVRKYYTFLTEVLGCLLPECVEKPPPEGWPNITEESLAGLEKTKAVIEVLRHLPYIKSSVDFNTKIAFATEAIDFREWKVAIGEKHKYIPVGSEDLPPHAIALTYMSDGSGSELILDTERNTITDYMPQEPRKAHMPEPETTSELWRWHETHPVAAFFDTWIQKFRTLEWTVNPFDAEDGMMLRWDRMTDEVRQIYRDHGWPDDFQREECFEALQEWDLTIKERLSEHGHSLYQITRTPPGQHDSSNHPDNDDEPDDEQHEDDEHNDDD